MEIKHEFEFIGKIGEGCFADVWKAKDNINRDVAIKIFKPSAVFVSDEANLQNTISKMLLNHAKLLARVDHPNIVKIYHVTRIEDPINKNPVDCIVMEFLPGVTLEKKLETSLSIDEAVLIGDSIINGMQAIHKNDIAHNDLHAKNIIVSSENVKIIDPRYDESTFVLLSSVTKEQLVKSDMRFLKETLRDIIEKTPEVSMEKADIFRNKTRNENDPQKIRELFNEALAGKTVASGTETKTEDPEAPVQHNLDDKADILDKVKEYIADDRYKIQLDGLVTAELKKVIPKLNKDSFPLREPQPNAETILERLKAYENITPDLETVMIALAHWGHNNHLPIYNKVLSRMADNIEMEGGLVYWTKLRWYPLHILFYCSGISAISAGNYQYLYSLFFCKLQTNDDYDYESKYLINLLAKNLTQISRGDEIFKTLPKYERLFVPTSEYMFQAINPVLEDILFLGKSYETLFDKFEIFFALVYADLNANGRFGPTGRFIYKYKDRFDGVKKNNLYDEVIAEAATKKSNWEPLQAGLFNGSYERFIEVAEGYRKFMESIQWH